MINISCIFNQAAQLTTIVILSFVTIFAVGEKIPPKRSPFANGATKVSLLRSLICSIVILLQRCRHSVA